MASKAKRTPVSQATTDDHITLGQSAHIPFDKLTITPTNVRRIQDWQSITDLARDIATRGLLQSLNVRALPDGDLYEVVAGGRRFRALGKLVEQGRMAPDAPVLCVIGVNGLGVDDSLAENMHRQSLHPVEQFRAFEDLFSKGMSIADIAARYFVSAQIVAQRLKLATVAPELLQAYVDNEMTLAQLTAFTLTDDTARQIQVWTAAQGTWQADAYHLRRTLLETKVSTSDKRVRFVGLEAYEAAGGGVTRDLFSETADGCQFVEDMALLDRLVAEKLLVAAEPIAAEGWKWVVAGQSPDHAAMAGSIHARRRPPSHEQNEALSKLRDAHRTLVERFEAAPAEEEDELEAQLADLQSAIDQAEAGEPTFDAEEIPFAGAYVAIGHDGHVTVQRGFVRREDAAALEAMRCGDAPEPGVVTHDENGNVVEPVQSNGSSISFAGAATQENEETVKPLSAALVTDLSIYKTLALRDALSINPALALVGLIHNLAVATFAGRWECGSPLAITAQTASRQGNAVGAADLPFVIDYQVRHDQWATRLPEQTADYFEFIGRLSADDQSALLAHCAAATLDLVIRPFNGASKAALETGDVIAAAAGLDVSAGWSATAENYLGRVSKARIVEAVTEGKGESEAGLIAHLKKGDMAREAQRMLEGTGWLPQELRIAGERDGDDPLGYDAGSDEAAQAEALPAFLHAAE